MAITDTDIGFLVCQQLKTKAGVTSLVGSGSAARIRPDHLDENETMPAIRYQVVNTNQWTLLNAPPQECQTRLQIDCYGTTRMSANQLADAVRDAINGFSGTLGTIRVHDCVLENRYDQLDPPSDGSKTWRKRRTLDFVITHTEPVPSLA